MQVSRRAYRRYMPLETAKGREGPEKKPHSVRIHRVIASTFALLLSGPTYLGRFFRGHIWAGVEAQESVGGKKGHIIGATLYSPSPALTRRRTGGQKKIVRPPAFFPGFTPLLLWRHLAMKEVFSVNNKSSSNSKSDFELLPFAIQAHNIHLYPHLYSNN